MNKFVLGISASLVFSLPLVCFAQAAQTQNETDDSDAKVITKSVLPLEDLRVFTKAYEHIRSSYITEMDDKTLLEHAIRGMLDELDPHSSYLDSSSFDNLQVNTKGEFGGLGIEVSMENGFIKVVTPMDDTPAARAGIEAGDLIIKIGDTPVKGLSLSQAVEKMRGPKGSPVDLTIVREGVDQPLELTVERDIIQVRSVRSELLEDSYAYIRIAQFQANTGRDALKALKKLQKKAELKGVVLDLRNNPGGLLDTSVDVSDIFLDGGLVVYTEGRMTESDFRYEAKPGDVTGGLPVVVLINEGSASASEIVAGALQDHERAVILGTRSFGKGSVQSVIPITDEKAIKLTTALYYTPNGRSIQAEGIAPDIVVERAKITTLKKRAGVSEAQLEGRLDQPDSDKKSQEKEEDDGLGLAKKDNQLYEAINILKGFAILKNKTAKNDTDS